MTSRTETVELRELVLPAQANHHGTLFAGQGLQLLAKAAFLAAREKAGRECVMARAHSVDFLAPVPVGHQLVLRATVARMGRASMTVQVVGLADRPGVAPHEVLRGEFEMVAIDTSGRPAGIEGAPPTPAAPSPHSKPSSQETQP